MSHCPSFSGGSTFFPPAPTVSLTDDDDPLLLALTKEMAEEGSER